MSERTETQELPKVAEDIADRFPGAVWAVQHEACDSPMLWVDERRLPNILRYLKDGAPRTYPMLFDLAAFDERERRHREGLPQADFTLGYSLLSLERNEGVILKTALVGEHPRTRSVADVYPNANWYEREAYDMFGIGFEGHPLLRRILMPPGWVGHPLRKEYPARATDMPEFTLPERQEEAQEEALRFRPIEWGIRPKRGDTDIMFLNLGPQHPGTHGVLRVVLELEGVEIVDTVMDIGFHHRGAEKMGERQSWHSYIPFTDRIEYLSGTLNEMSYLLGVERLAGIEVPDRAKVIRVMMCELFRICSHLVWYGTFAQDVGALSPIFYMFSDRERGLGIVEAVCGQRLHPSWFRIGGTSQDLPEGWDRLVLDFCDWMDKRMPEYDDLVMRNVVFRNRTRGVGHFTLKEAIDWGATGPNLRACGMAYDFRKKRPYSGYDQFEFEVPTATHGDCYDRAVVRVEEIRQSLGILRQCVKEMPAGPHKADHPLTTPPAKERTMHDIETLISHFLNVSWGPPIPAGEALVPVEQSKGATGYWSVSDGATIPYRIRIRTPSFAHLQMVPTVARGWTIPDLMAILGSFDYVLSDVDR